MVIKALPDLRKKPKDKCIKACEALRCCCDYLFLDRWAEEQTDTADYKFNTYNEEMTLPLLLSAQFKD